jgi:hypothetical protein
LKCSIFSKATGSLDAEARDHLMVEAMRRVYAVHRNFFADPGTGRGYQ